MLEYDMLRGEFVDHQPCAPEFEHCDRTCEPWVELRLLNVHEAEAERNRRR